MYFLKCFCCGPDHAPEEPDEPLKEQTSPRTFIRSKQAKYASTCAVHDDLQCAVALLPTASHELETLRNGGENEDLRRTFPCVSSVIPAVVDISNDVSAISSPEFQGLALGNYQVHHGVDNGIGVSSSACECASRRSVMSAPGVNLFQVTVSKIIRQDRQLVLLHPVRSVCLLPTWGGVDGLCYGLYRTFFHLDPIFRGRRYTLIHVLIPITARLG